MHSDVKEVFKYAQQQFDSRRKQIPPVLSHIVPPIPIIPLSHIVSLVLDFKYSLSIGVLTADTLLVHQVNCFMEEGAGSPTSTFIIHKPLNVLSSRVDSALTSLITSKSHPRCGSARGPSSSFSFIYVSFIFYINYD